MADDHHLRYKRVGSVQLWTAYEEVSPNDFGDKVKVGGRTFRIEPNMRRYWDSLTKGLDFKFHYETSSTDNQGRVGSGSVSILGLSGDTIRSLVSYATPEENRRKRKFITVYAGYEDEAQDDAMSGEGLFTMRYIGADMTPPPDMWLNFKAEASNAILNEEVVSGSIWTDSPNGLTIKEVCREIAKSLNIGFRWYIEPELEKYLPRLNGFDWSGGSSAYAVRLINELGVVTANVERYLSGRYKGYYGLAIRCGIKGGLQALEIQRQLELGHYKVISAENGMIGLPQYTPQSETSGGGAVKVKTLLRKDIKINDLIQIKSQYMPQLFPWYRVNTITYDGHFRGQEWYSTFDAIYEPPAKEGK